MAKIRVALRVRPLSQREVDGGFPVVIAVEDNSTFVTDIRVPERPKADSRPRYRQFQFDHGFWLEEGASEGAAQSEVYRQMGPPLEKSALDGFNACLLAYGQSGTGKTHTMLGSRDDPGLIPRLCHNIWEKLKAKEETENKSKFRMEVSFMEIYREKVRDLLSPTGGHLKLREHPQYGPHVQNLTRVEVTEENLLVLLWEGESRRAIGTTGSNRRSSRSHAIWTIYLTRESNQKSPNHSLITNQVHLVDLAGSEKAGFATAKNLLAEGADINRSLVALGNVISALGKSIIRDGVTQTYYFAIQAERAQYIPYRDSALTWLLKDSLGGNATTAIIITSSPASCCHAQTLNSFRFAQRARLVENRPRINLTSALSPLSPSTAVGATRLSAIYSIMSAFEVKKDISRLSKMIRGAQNNGGILRGLAPRASWTRLVNALEGWNQIESEQLKLQRAASEDTTAGSSIQTASQTDASSKNSTDAVSSSPSKDSTTTLSSKSSKQNSPNRIIGTEVFIPTSSSIKCLTWKQEEVQPPPKLPTPPEEYADIEFSAFMTPPPTPTPSGSSSKIDRKKYLLPVQFPTTNHLDHPSRISERIHSSFSGELPPLEKITPVQMCEGDSPLIRNRIPTLVNPKEIAPTECYENTLFTHVEKVVPGKCKRVEFEFSCEGGGDDSNEDSDSESESTLLAEISVPKQREVIVLEKVDLNEISKSEIKGEKVTLSSASRCRLVNQTLPKRHNFTLQLPPMPSIFSSLGKRKSKVFEDISEGEVSEEEMNGEADEVNHYPPYHTVSESYSKLLNLSIPHDTDGTDISYFSSNSMLPSPMLSYPLSTCSSVSKSDSSCNSWDFSYNHRPTPTLVQVMPEELEDESDFEESINDWINADPHPIVSTVSLNLESEQSEDEEDINSKSEDDVPDSKSKFQNHFAQELSQMDKIGKQLKELRKMSQQCQRYSVVQPFLEKIFELEKDDHHLPDKKLDQHIESCSGWNVKIEYDKVNSEINSLNKLLKTGIVPSSSYNRMSSNVANKSNWQSRRDSEASTSTSASETSKSTIPSSSTQSQRSPTSPHQEYLMNSRFLENSLQHHQNQASSTRNKRSVSSSGRNASSEYLVAARNSHSEPAMLPVQFGSVNDPYTHYQQPHHMYQPINQPQQIHPGMERFPYGQNNYLPPSGTMQTPQFDRYNYQNIRPLLGHQFIQVPHPQQSQMTFPEGPGYSNQFAHPQMNPSFHVGFLQPNAANHALTRSGSGSRSHSTDTSDSQPSNGSYNGALPDHNSYQNQRHSPSSSRTGLDQISSCSSYGLGYSSSTRSASAVSQNQGERECPSSTESYYNDCRGQLSRESQVDFANRGMSADYNTAHNFTLNAGRRPPVTIAATSSSSNFTTASSGSDHNFTPNLNNRGSDTRFVKDRKF